MTMPATIRAQLAQLRAEFAALAAQRAAERRRNYWQSLIERR